jgi:hypothetical protein
MSRQNGICHEFPKVGFAVAKVVKVKLDHKMLEGCSFLFRKKIWLSQLSSTQIIFFNPTFTFLSNFIDIASIYILI